MAQQRAARLISAHNVGSHARLLEFTLEDELGFTGGQYIIVNTGIPIAGDKIAKRAYSILSGDTQQQRFQIAVRRIGSGPGSNYMFDLPLGAELAFSGPWGKYLPHDSQANERNTIILATDTGITAAMGLVSAGKFAPHRERTTLLWIAESDAYFLPEDFVRTRVADLCQNLEIIRVSADPEQRANWMSTHKSALLQRIQQEHPAVVFLSGDGFLLAELRDALQDGQYPTEVLIESFFHHQELKAVKVAASS